ncbi:MAG: hypothetical protein M4D80_03825 [Myxococcota bacterium]|nr:hypothetical protein [Myxococcota bacterium]
MNTPSEPDDARRERLLSITAEFVARGGAASLMLPPVKPGGAAFPEPWKPTRGGVEALLRRLAWHAGGLGERSVTIKDQRLGAPPTEHKPQTRVDLVEVRPKELAFAVGYIGEDDIVGTLAHEVGVAFAALHRPDEADPYRTQEQPVIPIDQDRDLERGSIATVYLGLGVLAANAAFQQYSSRVAVDAYQPTVYEVHRAGYVKMSDLAFLLAVQVLVRGERTAPPGLGAPQRDEVNAWLEALAGRASELRTQLGVSGAEDKAERPKPVRFVDVDMSEDVAAVKRNGFRWETHRGGVGMIAGLALGLGIAIAAAPSQVAFWSISIGGVGVGSVLGRRIQAVRCSNCATVIGANAQSCRKCGSAMRGNIKRLSDRLEAEERLETHDSH